MAHLRVRRFLITLSVCVAMSGQHRASSPDQLTSEAEAPAQAFHLRLCWDELPLVLAPSAIPSQLDNLMAPAGHMPQERSPLSQLLGSISAYQVQRLFDPQLKNDPFYSAFGRNVLIDAGPFFYQRTALGFTKGLILKRFWDGKVDVGIFKRGYTQSFSQLGDRLEDLILRSNQGLYRSRWIFGRGRQYVFMVKFNF